jgi:ribonuclease III
MRTKQITAGQNTVTTSESDHHLGWSSRIQNAFAALRGAVLRRFQPNPNTMPRSNDQAVVEAFYAGRVQREIQYRFGDQATLIMALKHRSYVYAQDESGVQSNERLEFLGDAVLDLIVSDFLYGQFPKRREGGLTQLRSSLVNKVTLADQAKKINLGKYLLLSDGEARSGGRQRGSILSDAYESLIGAMYLDGGVEPTREFISRTLLKDLAQYDSPHQWMNYKSVLLEYTQSDGQGQPRYRVESETGPDHSKVFTVEVYISDAATGRGTGTSKKDAEQNAARDAAERLNLLASESE